jgi:hypothetical protein
MRKGSAVLLMAGAALACRSEPDFDERYEAAEQRIERKAQSIDRELAADRNGRDSDPAERGNPSAADDPS